MRVIAGRLGGRVFESPRGHRTHPMSDRARGGLFNTLGDIEGLTVLDAFAGSGALGFEAVSRGASQVVAIDSDKAAQQAIAENIRVLGIEEGSVKLIKASANAWLQTAKNPQFDLVLCDPPFDDLQPNLLARLASCVKLGGLLALSWPGKQNAPDFDEFERVATNSYGDNQLIFYRRAS